MSEVNENKLYDVPNHNKLADEWRSALHQITKTLKIGKLGDIIDGRHKLSGSQVIQWSADFESEMRRLDENYNAIISNLRGLYTRTLAHIEEHEVKIENKIEEIIEKIEDNVESVARTVKDEVEETAKDIKEEVNKIASNIKKEVAEVVDKIEDGIEGLEGIAGEEDKPIPTSISELSGMLKSELVQLAESLGLTEYGSTKPEIVQSIATKLNIEN